MGKRTRRYRREWVESGRYAGKVCAMTPALPFLLAALAAGGFVGPTPAEFARAVGDFTGKPVKVANVRHLSCKGFGDYEPTEAACSWRQRMSGKWKRYSTSVAVDGRGWHLIDEPNPER